VARFILVQLGVVRTRLGVSAVAVESEDRWMAEFPTPASAREWVKLLRGKADRLKAPGAWGVLVSVPGIVDEGTARVLFSPNLHWTERTDLRGLIRRVWDLPVLLVQEERALALGHEVFDPNDEDFLLVDFGEGLGAAVITSGRLYQSPLPISGEIGHTPVLGNERPCGCGGTGCTETLVSTRGLLQSFAAAHPGGRHDWPALVGQVGQVRQGDLPGWLTEALDAAAVAVAGALNVLGLRRVVITGDLSELGPRVIDRLSQSIRRGTMWARFGRVDCEVAPRRRIAGLVAAGIDRLVLAPGGEASSAGRARASF
jgi:predicted NBD/HSP70 family sugar kinase